MATFTPVNELERLLARAAVDPAGRPVFFRALPEHDLFVITEGHIPERAGLITFNEETPLRLRQVERDGSWCFPVFTSVERISAVVPETVGFVAIKGASCSSCCAKKCDPQSGIRLRKIADAAGNQRNPRRLALWARGQAAI